MMKAMKNSDKPLFYIFCAEVIPVLVTLTVALEPLSDMLIYSDKISFWNSGYMLWGVLVVIYFAGCFHYVRKGFTTVSNFFSTTTRMLVLHIAIGVCGCLGALLANDINQCYILFMWVGFEVFNYYNTDKQCR